MTPVNWNQTSASERVTVSPSRMATRPATPSSDSESQVPASAGDTLHLSPAALRETALTGRIAANVEAGKISTDQGAQLYGQLSSIHDQIVSGSDAQTIGQAQNQLSQAIYADAHNGAPPPADPNVTRAGVREAVMAGRIALNKKAGNLSGDQANQLMGQLGSIHQQITAGEQANGGSLSPADAKAIDQAQNQLSRSIYDSAHQTQG